MAKKINTFSYINSILYKSGAIDVGKAYNRVFINFWLCMYESNLTKFISNIDVLNLTDEQHYKILYDMIPRIRTRVLKKRPSLNLKTMEYPEIITRSLRDYPLLEGEYSMKIIEKYAPTTINTMILPDVVIKQILTILEDPNNIAHMLFSGAAGMGKTTLAKLIFNHLGINGLHINAGRHGSVEHLRNVIIPYCSKFDIQASVLEGIDSKFILFDEFDTVSAKYQEDFKGVVTEFKDDATFIITTNHPHTIIDHISSRLSGNTFDFDEIFRENKKEMLIKLVNRLIEIMEAENIKYSREFVIKLINTYYPDIRTVFNKLGFYMSKYGSLEDIKVIELEENELYDVLKSKDFEKITNYAFNVYNFGAFYKTLSKIAINTSAEAVGIVAKSSMRFNQGVTKGIQIADVMLDLSKIKGGVKWKE